MELNVKIMDFGASELRLGDAGDIDFTHKTPSSHFYNISEFRSFMTNNSTGLSNRNTLALFIEKNTKNLSFRTKICQYIFEEEGYNSIMLMKSAPLSLFSVGRTSGLVLENSETSNELVYVDDSCVEQKYIKKGKVSMLDVMKQWTDSHTSFQQIRQRVIDSPTGETILPDGRNLRMNSLIDSQNKLLEYMYEKFKLTEVLCTGRVLFNNHVSMALKSSLRNHHYQLLNPSAERFEATSSFIGASILGQISNIKHLVVTQKQYQDYGMEFINSIFF